MVCDKCVREKDSHLPPVFNERVVQEFGCNNPDRRMHFIVYLLEYQNHTDFFGWLFCFVLFEALSNWDLVRQNKM